MKKKLFALALIATMMFSTTACANANAPATETNTVETEIVREMTVDDVVSKAGCDYFIVKEIDTWAVLEEDVYMDRPVTEINICDDTEDTLCIFIDLADDEEPRIKQW